MFVMFQSSENLGREETGPCYAEPSLPKSELAHLCLTLLVFSKKLIK